MQAQHDTLALLCYFKTRAAVMGSLCRVVRHVKFQYDVGQYGSAVSFKIISSETATMFDNTRSSFALLSPVLCFVVSCPAISSRTIVLKYSSRLSSHIGVMMCGTI